MRHVGRSQAFAISPGRDGAICSNCSSDDEFDAERLSASPDHFALLPLRMVRYECKTEAARHAGTGIDNDFCATSREVGHQTRAGRFLTLNRDPGRLMMAPPGPLAF